MADVTGCAVRKVRCLRRDLSRTSVWKAMLTLKGAWLQVFLEIRRQNGLRQGWNELVIVDEQVFEVPGGWVFPYTTRGFLAGKMEYAIGGNRPIFINRSTGEMRSWVG